MPTKQELIQQMLRMQKQFIARERESGVDLEDYFTPRPGDLLDGYRETFADIATQVVDLAHEEKGSKR
ncbi:MAG: hypothetical protein QGI35_00750 [Arenicellales bacterium]|jgi:hypothetical protein|nr:hypothetical protein [Acidiferrobacteraceae bacterium]MDP6136295.1 hypothetical protein [Arenicellales bacterium]MDP6391482.1 hypothetical protein [Arenicellales bacterium]HJP09591.1 hypothetical protein [Arenicellales bacterium]